VFRALKPTICAWCLANARQPNTGITSNRRNDCTRQFLPFVLTGVVASLGIHKTAIFETQPGLGPILGCEWYGPGNILNSKACISTAEPARCQCTQQPCGTRQHHGGAPELRTQRESTKVAATAADEDGPRGVQTSPGRGGARLQDLRRPRSLSSRQRRCHTVSERVSHLAGSAGCTH